MTLRVVDIESVNHVGWHLASESAHAPRLCQPGGTWSVGGWHVRPCLAQEHGDHALRDGTPPVVARDAGLQQIFGAGRQSH